MFRDAGRSGLADRIENGLVGRDVLPGMWSFQIVEAYDDGYWSTFREVERSARRALGSAEPHIFEAEMKLCEQGGCGVAQPAESSSEPVTSPVS